VKKLAVKRLLGKVIHRDRAAVSRRVILLYHSIGDSLWAVTAEEFRAQMRWLHDNAQLMSVEDLLESGDGPGLRVAVSFDDGYATLFRAAAPIAREFGLKPLVFLNAGFIGNGRRVDPKKLSGVYPGEDFLLWDEVRQLATEGWSFGSHGITHIDFTGIHAILAEAQLRESKAMIEQSLGLPCDTFSYTWGHHNGSVRDLVSVAGYRYGFAALHGAVRANFDPLAIPRINISNEYSLSDFEQIISGDWDFLSRIQSFRTFVRGFAPAQKSSKPQF